MPSRTSPPSPIRVLFVLTSFVGGGAERSLLELLRRIDRRIVEPVLAVLDATGPLRKDFAQLGLPMHELGAYQGLARLRGATLLAAALRFRPHVVHGRLLLANLWARLGRLVGAKVVCEERNLTLDRPAGFNAVNRASMRLCSVMVANSQAVAAYIVKRDHVPASRLRVIPCGVDTQRFVPTTAPRPFDIVSITRIERSKGVLDLIEAVRIVAARRPGTRVLLVGEGSMRASLQTMLREQHLAETIELAGWQERSELALARGKLFALASHEEGMPNVVLEAMAAALPVVATAVGGTVEVVAPGTTGTLVPPRSPAAFAEAVLRYLDRPELMATHGAAGRQRVLDQFAITGTVRAYERLYQELVSA